MRDEEQQRDRNDSEPAGDASRPRFMDYRTLQEWYMNEVNFQQRRPVKRRISPGSEPSSPDENDNADR